MLTKLSHRNKLVLLGIIGLLTLIICWKLAFRKSVNRYRACKELQGNVAMISNAPQKTASIRLELDEIAKILGKSDSSGHDNRQQLLEMVSRYCEKEKIRIVEIPDPVFSEKGEYMLEMNKVVIEGNFHKLNRFVYLIERQATFGRLVSVKYEKTKDIRTKTTKLRVELLIQNIMRNNET